MNYNFIEVGTADFDTLGQSADDSILGISIDPMRELLEPLKMGEKVTKVYAAIAKEDGCKEIFYMTKEDVKEFNLPDWILASSAIGSINPNISRELNVRGISFDAVRRKEVRMLSWDTIFRRFEVRSVKTLKVDAEGMDCEIVSSFLDACDSLSVDLPSLIWFEARQEMTKQRELKELLAKCKESGYGEPQHENQDIYLHLTEQ